MTQFSSQWILSLNRLSHFWGQVQTQLSSLAEQSVVVPEAKIGFHRAYENLSLPFALNQGPAPQQMRMRSFDIGSQLAPTTNNPLPRLWQPAKIERPPVKANQFIGHAPPEWFTNAVPHNAAPYRMPGPGGDLQYYGHHIPLAGRIILGVGKQAKFHPRVTRVIGLISPGSGGGKPSPSRWTGR
jgi:hypothetical protein